MSDEQQSSKQTSNENINQRNQRMNLEESSVEVNLNLFNVR